MPETKRGYELLREMQREKQHMRIVIDEYGGVSGLVTIEDLLEEIVGNIRDEHEEESPSRSRSASRTASWLVPGSFPVDQLADLFGETGSNWATPTRPRRWAAWSARSRAAFRWPARWCCWNKRPAHGGGRLDGPSHRAAAGVSAGRRRQRHTAAVNRLEAEAE